MQSFLTALLFTAFSLSASAAPRLAGLPQPILGEETAVSSFQAQVLPGGAIRVPAGAAEELGLSVGAYDLVDEDGNPDGQLRVRADGSLLLQASGKATDRASSRDRVIALEVYVDSDGECTYHSVFVQYADGTSRWSFFSDCATVVNG